MHGKNTPLRESEESAGASENEEVESPVQVINSNIKPVPNSNMMSLKKADQTKQNGVAPGMEQEPLTERIRT